MNTYNVNPFHARGSIYSLFSSFNFYELSLYKYFFDFYYTLYFI